MRPVIKDETILASSNEATFNRGEKYYNQGKVINAKSNGNSWEAVVAGTHNYQVRLDTTTLESWCDCYAFTGSQWCKHIVALALHSTHGPPEPKPQKPKNLAKPRVKDTLQSLIDESTEEQLRQALSLVAHKHPAVKSTIQSALHLQTFESSKDVVSAIKKSIQPVKRARSWNRIVQTGLQAQSEIYEIAESIEPSEEMVRGLLGAALYLYGQVMQIDDSDGTLQAACRALCQRAIEIINNNPSWIGLIDESLGVDSDLPLADYVLDFGNQQISEHLISRLEKHLYKRDPNFSSTLADYANYLLLDHLSKTGDPRFVDLLSEHTLQDSTALDMRIHYHAARSEWKDVISLIWPIKDQYRHTHLLRRALGEVGDSDKIIDLAIDDAMHSPHVRQSIAQLKHLLEQCGRVDELPALTDRLIASPSLPLGERLQVLAEANRYDDAANLILDNVNPDKERSKHPLYNTSALQADIDTAISHLNRFPEEHDSSAIKAWRRLFEVETKRALNSSRYERLELIGSTLSELGDLETVHDMAARIIENYPTRKKLVDLCRYWLAETKPWQ